METTVKYRGQEEDEIAHLLVGRKVTKVEEDKILLDDGTQLQFRGNEGCGGCTSGWYELKELHEVDNIITRVEVISDRAKHYDDVEVDEHYEIFVYAENQKLTLARFEGSDGNGYYGTGFTIHVQRP